MKSFATPDFWKAYLALLPELKEKARKAYQLWQENQSHPSLYFLEASLRESQQRAENLAASAISHLTI